MIISVKSSYDKNMKYEVIFVKYYIKYIKFDIISYKLCQNTLKNA